MNLWGCTFEDFLTRQKFADNRNIVNNYLKDEVEKKTLPTKPDDALRSSVMSLYEVSNILFWASRFSLVISYVVETQSDSQEVGDAGRSTLGPHWCACASAYNQKHYGRWRAALRARCGLKTSWKSIRRAGRTAREKSAPNSRARSGGRLTIRSSPRRSATARYCALRRPVYVVSAG